MKYEKGSFIVVPNRGKLRGVGGNAQCLFMWLCSYANTEGNCFPSINKLAEDVGCSARTIIREMERLVDLGVVVKNTRKTKDSYLSNEYNILVLEEGGSDTQTLPSDSVTLGVVSNSHTNSIHLNSKKNTVDKSTVSFKEKEGDTELVEVDEDGNEIKRKNTTKEPKNKVAIAIVKSFNDLCKKHIGKRPIMDTKGYIQTLRAMKVLTRPQIDDLLEDWFLSGKPDEETIHITRALSASQVNIYLARH